MKRNVYETEGYSNQQQPVEYSSLIILFIIILCMMYVFVYYDTNITIVYGGTVQKKMK